MTCSHWGCRARGSQSSGLVFRLGTSGKGILTKTTVFPPYKSGTPAKLRRGPETLSLTSRACLRMLSAVFFYLSWDVHSTRGHRCVGTCCQCWSLGLGLSLAAGQLSHPEHLHPSDKHPEEMLPTHSPPPESRAKIASSISKCLCESPTPPDKHLSGSFQNREHQAKINTFVFLCRLRESFLRVSM